MQCHLFYKLLDCKKENRKMVQLRDGIPDETFIEQILMKLNLNGYHQVKVEMGGTNSQRKVVMSMDDLQLRIILDFELRKCSVESRQSVGQLKAISDLVR